MISKIGSYIHKHGIPWEKLNFFDKLCLGVYLKKVGY